MTKNLDNTGFRSIVQDYDFFFIDLWGVVHNGINLHNNSIWMKPYTRYISKAVFKNLTLCCVPSESIFKNAQKIMPKESIIITGDSRFDQILERCKNQKS